MLDDNKQEQPSVGSRKTLIRQAMIRQREDLSPAACARASAAVGTRFRELREQLDLVCQPLRIGVYAATRKELDLSAIWQDERTQSDAFYFPAICGRGPASSLVFGRLPVGSRPEDFLVPGRLGIAEPPAASWLSGPPALDIILLPGLAFDRQGNRLGWGRAYYDRFLQTMPNRPVLVGIGYTFQLLPDLLPVEPTDYPVDWLLTPDQCQKSKP